MFVLNQNQIKHDTNKTELPVSASTRPLTNIMFIFIWLLIPTQIEKTPSSQRIID